ncbi:MAG: CDGSH iron-sulfur domain-containing protein [Chromatiales bacterium]|nr:CDGSH iron-sulfur domain-containing protein [Chromatiales bacterium]
MSDPVIVTDTPFAVTVEEGKTYYWCSCGKSQSQPFCDGSHAGSDFTPIEYTATESKELYFCGCKATKAAPFCDGSHKD